MGDEGTWLTKAELARVRKISVASADRLIRRQGWRRQPGNDGRVRVFVPTDWATPGPRHPTDNQSPDPTDKQPSDPTDRLADPTNISAAITAFDAALATLREHSDRERDRADKAEVKAEAERARADRAEARMEAERERAERAEQGRAAADARADALRDRAEAAELRAGRAENAAHQAEMLEHELAAEHAELRDWQSRQRLWAAKPWLWRLFHRPPVGGA